MLLAPVVASFVSSSVRSAFQGIVSVGKRALNSLWEEYKNLPVAGPSAGSKRARTPDEFELETDMTQWDEEEIDELET